MLINSCGINLFQRGMSESSAKVLRCRRLVRLILCIILVPRLSSGPFLEASCIVLNFLHWLTLRTISVWAKLLSGFSYPWVDQLSSIFLREGQCWLSQKQSSDLGLLLKHTHSHQGLFQLLIAILPTVLMYFCCGWIHAGWCQSDQPKFNYVVQWFFSRSVIQKFWKLSKYL